MKIIFTGASGLLGEACRIEFNKPGIEFHALHRDTAWRMVLAHNKVNLIEADVVIHAAANTNVEQCERDPDACYRDNFLLTEGLATVCAVNCTPLVYVSSTGVYGEGEDTPYREYSVVRPTTHHHRAKWLGEMAVMAASTNNLVIRTGWLFGGQFNNPKNFVARRLEEAIRARGNGVPLISNDEQRGCPTYTVDLASRMLYFISKGYHGIFNVVNSGSASRFEYIRSIVELAGIDVPIQKAPAAAFKRLAKVSRNEMAFNWRANELGLPELPNWLDRLKDYISEKYEGKRC